MLELKLESRAGVAPHLNGFADRCLGCSANGTSLVQNEECRVQNSKNASMPFRDLHKRAEKPVPASHVSEPQLFSAADAVYEAVTGWFPLSTPSYY